VERGFGTATGHLKSQIYLLHWNLLAIHFEVLNQV
jgi:hypothetical protein